MDKQTAALLLLLPLLVVIGMCEHGYLPDHACAIIGGALAVGMLLLTKEKSR